jgi:adenylate kinase
LNPVENVNKCPNCGGALAHRDDDNETVVRRRILSYHTQTEPLLAYYKSRNLLHPVEGLGTVDEVRARVTEILESLNGDPDWRARCLGKS